MYKWKIVVTAVTFAKADLEPFNRLKAIGCEVITNSHGRPLTEGEMVNVAQDADALIVGNDKITSAIIRSCPKLKVIIKVNRLLVFAVKNWHLTLDVGFFV